MVCACAFVGLFVFSINSVTPMIITINHKIYDFFEMRASL